MQEYLSKEEIHELLQKSDWKAAWGIIQIWLIIIGAFTLVYFWSNPITIILALFILGSKQLGCAIIMHDTSHYSLFNSRKLNDIIGNWFGAYLFCITYNNTGLIILQHHKATGTEDDPDINLANGYPTTKASMARKIGRDLVGATGVKGNIALFAMHIGILKYNLGNFIEKAVVDERSYLLKSGWTNLRGPIVSNLILFLICLALGRPWLYFLWPVANLTTYNLILRIRSIAEHSLVKDKRDPLQNSRTVHANWLERIIFCPLNVNYHLEHHLLFTVPSYNFKKMHGWLWERGLYEKANYSEGYWNIIKMAMSKRNERIYLMQVDSELNPK